MLSSVSGLFMVKPLPASLNEAHERGCVVCVIKVPLFLIISPVEQIEINGILMLLIVLVSAF
jgi:hypothetical protein